MGRWSVKVAMLVVGVALCATVSYAGWSQRVGELANASVGTFETTVVTSSSVLSGFSNGSILYGFTTHASAASSECGLYDTNSLGTATATQGVFIDEGGEASQYDTFQSNWPSPYRLQIGLAVVVNAGTCVVYHDVR